MRVELIETRQKNEKLKTLLSDKMTTLNTTQRDLEDTQSKLKNIRKLLGEL